MINLSLILNLGLTVRHIVEVHFINISLSTGWSFLIVRGRIKLNLPFISHLILTCIPSLFHTRFYQNLGITRIISTITHWIVPSNLSSSILKRLAQLSLRSSTIALLLDLSIHKASSACRLRFPVVLANHLLLFPT